MCLLYHILNQLHITIKEQNVDFPTPKDYSTSEVDTGVKWIDGQPIYRRVFTGNYNTNDTLTLMNNFTGKIINFEGYIEYTSGSKGWYCIGGNISKGDLETNMVYQRKSDSTMRLWLTGANISTSSQYAVTVYYVKQ